MKLNTLVNFRVKYSLLLFFQRFKRNIYFKSEDLDSSCKKVFIFLAADYGNLGDVAITYAQTKFLKNYSDCQVYEIPISKSLEGLWFVKKNIKDGDIVTTVGGGNMGDLYDQIEYIRQLVVRFFPDNMIISFPQTIDFSSNVDGKKALNKAKKVYNNHKNLHIFAREQTSFKVMKDSFKANIYLCPDIVLSLNKVNKELVRKGVVLCLRDDSEKLLNSDQILMLKNLIADRFSQIENYDTHIGRGKLTLEERDNELKKIWRKFSNAELVVTDRLHGMIFCYITNTPCLVFQNNNHKVRETYNWIKDHSNIRLITSFDNDEIRAFIEKDSFGGVPYRDLKDKYQNLISLLS